MPPRSQRFNRAEFGIHFKSGTRRHTPHLTLISSPGSVKLAVVVSKKVASQATERNRLRRRLYALARELVADRACIIIAKPPLAKLTRSQFINVIKSEIADLLNGR